MRVTFKAQAFAALLLCSLHTYSAEERSAAAEQVSLSVRANTAWLAEAKTCPSEVMPLRPSTNDAENKICKPSQFTSCLSKCASGIGESCFWLAYGIQQVGSDPADYEPLYQRACKLGVISGCTNRAAGMSVAEPDNPAIQQCAAKTFAKACAFDDPWACTMYALHLTKGMGVPRNTDLALKVLAKSCRHDSEDPACTAGMKLKAEIEQGIKGRAPPK